VVVDLEERIIAFTARERAMKVGRIRLDSRLSEDLGMDGDAAVEFFRAFGTDFNVNLDSLQQHWDRHFLSEGSSPSLGFLIAIGASVVIGDLLHRVVHPIPSWALTIVLLCALAWAYNRFFTEGPNLSPITVQDLVDAASAGKWTIYYDERVVEFRTLP
jgi:hypothetical protein